MKRNLHLMIKNKDGWFIGLSIDKNSLDDITYFDAVLEE